MSNTHIPQEILTAFFGDDVKDVTVHGDGHVNTTFLVVTNIDKKFIVQSISSIFTEALADDVAIVLAHLAKDGWRVPRTPKDKDGHYYVADKNGQVWRAFTYIKSDPVNEKVFDEATLKEIGILLARLHHSLISLDYQPRFSIAHFHETSHFAEHLELIMHKLSDDAQELSEKTLEAYHKLPTPSWGQSQLIHGDPRIANILFSDGKPFTFIDFDTLMVGSIWLDVGDLLRSLAQLDPGFTLQKTQAVTEGYRTYHKSAIDRNNFFGQAVASAQIIALELTMRFLIDIYDASYFTWDDQLFPSRDAHHLSRAVTQWQIYEKYRKMNVLSSALF